MRTATEDNSQIDSRIYYDQIDCPLRSTCGSVVEAREFKTARRLHLQLADEETL